MSSSPSASSDCSTCSPEKCSRPEVQRALDDLDSTIGKMGLSLDELRNRLGCLLAERPVEKCRQESGACSPDRLWGQIDIQTRRIREVNVGLHHLLDELEL